MATQRPTLTADPDWLREARDVVDRFVAGLQAGIDTADAETYNAEFGEDVMWGSPYGATVIGYDALHSIHRGMFGRGVAVAGASSRYQTVHVMAPTPDVAIAHVRRVALDAGGEQFPIDGDVCTCAVRGHLVARCGPEHSHSCQAMSAMAERRTFASLAGIELVVKNFGRTSAYGIRFEFANPPTVGRYESAYEDRYFDIAPLNLPAEIPYLVPTQEWRIVWDSALDRRELGEAIASRFDGAVTYYDQPKTGRQGKQTRTQFRSTAVLDWATLHPVERLELLTTHDLARQEKQKLELLRSLLTYFHYAASESREEVLRAKINRVRSAADELRDRYRAQYTAPVNNNIAFDEAHTTVINGRHRREVN